LRLVGPLPLKTKSAPLSFPSHQPKLPPQPPSTPQSRSPCLHWPPSLSAATVSSSLEIQQSTHDSTRATLSSPQQSKPNRWHQREPHRRQHQGQPPLPPTRVKTFDTVTTTDNSLHNCQLPGIEEKKMKKSDLQWNRSKKKEENRSEKRRKNQKVCLCFSCFAGHRWRGKEEGRKSFQIHSSTGFSCNGVWTRR